jgi:hypothetical protein
MKRIALTGNRFPGTSFPTTYSTDMPPAESAAN